MNLPDINPEIVPEVSVAGFRLGKGLPSVLAKVGTVKWTHAESNLVELVPDSWVGSKRNLRLFA